MMMDGRVRGALKLLSDDSDTDLLSLNHVVDEVSGKTVREVLEDKHPDLNPVHPDVLLGDTDDNSFHPTLFVPLTAESLRAAPLHTPR